VNFWSGSNREYLIKNSLPVLVAEPTMFFEGWESYVRTQLDFGITTFGPNSEIKSESKKVNLKQELSKNQSQLKGRLGFTLEPGIHLVSSKFTQNTWSRILGNSISTIAWIGIFVYSFILTLSWVKFKILKKLIVTKYLN
jgi:hypothetical protein